MRAFTSLRRLPRLALVTAVVAVAGIVVAVAVAANPSTDRSFTPQKADQVTNVDVLRQQIANYYGDPGKTGIFSADSNYAREAEGVAKDGANWLGARSQTTNKAIVLDVDDTTLATWNYEIFSNWAFNPATNAIFVTEQRFPAVPGMVEMVNNAAAAGYAIFYLTGRPQTQEAATLGNLTSDGVGVDAAFGLRTGKQRRHRMRHARVCPARDHTKTHGLPLTDRIDGQRAAARDGLTGNQHHVQQQLDAILRQQNPGQIPAQAGLAVFDQAARHLLSIASIDLRAGRARGAECQPAELQLGGSRVRALLDQIHGELGGFLVLVLRHHFEAVHDRSNRADQVMANPRAQQRGEVEALQFNSARHGRSPGGWTANVRLSDSAIEREAAV